MDACAKRLSGLTEDEAVLRGNSSEDSTADPDSVMSSSAKRFCQSRLLICDDAYSGSGLVECVWFCYPAAAGSAADQCMGNESSLP